MHTLCCSCMGGAVFAPPIMLCVLRSTAGHAMPAAQHMVDNFIYLLETYGHIPNGIRTYYLNRRRAEGLQRCSHGQQLQ